MRKNQPEGEAVVVLVNARTTPITMPINPTRMARKRLTTMAMFASEIPDAIAAMPADSALRIALITPIKRKALSEAPSAGSAYDNAGMMRARMLAREGVVGAIWLSGVIKTSQGVAGFVAAGMANFESSSAAFSLITVYLRVAM